MAREAPGLAVVGALRAGDQDVGARVTAGVGLAYVGQVMAGPGEVCLVHLDRGLPVVGGHDDLDVGHGFGAERGATGPTEQIGHGNRHKRALSSSIVGARAGPTGRFGASNDLVAPTNRGRPGSRGGRRLSENRSEAEARSGPLRRVEAPVHDTRWVDRRVRSRTTSTAFGARRPRFIDLPATGDITRSRQGA